MSYYRRRWEEPAYSNWGPDHDGRSYYNDHSWRHYAPSTEFLPSRPFNYWQEEAPASYYPRRTHGESYEDQWRDDGCSRQASYHRRSRDFGPSRDWHDLGSRTDRNFPYGDSSRQRYSTYAPAPFISRPTFRPRSPVEPMPPMPKPAPSSAPRKVSSSPSKSSGTLKPNPSYLALSLAPSEILQDPEQVRKLLVLDLNGTLLVRSPRSRTSFGAQSRSVYPRPYMQSFRQYLFSPSTKTWLDTMVWSSAQPHSVDDMVDRVFGTTRAELKAVWNRKSLGLSEQEYHQKAITTKDLEKPWNVFTSALGLGKNDGHSMSTQSQSVHSALTTLLLDDSPHKAVLQPYNHACVPEYSNKRRQRDLQSLQVTKGSKHTKQAMQKSHVETSVDIVSQLSPEPSLRDGIPQESTEKEGYDAMLLAVIGILETIKLQSNVAGWIRSGGLWATQERLEEVSASDIKYRDAVHGDKLASGTAVRTGNYEGCASDPPNTLEEAHLRAKMWFDDLSILTYWATKGRKALADLGIPAIQDSHN